MDIRLKLIALLIGLAFMLVVFQSIRRSSIRPSFAWLWLLIALFLVSVPVLEPLYKWISVTIIGIDDARTVIYVPLIGFLLVYSFYITLVISKLSDRIQELISHTAVLEAELRRERPAPASESEPPAPA